MQFSRLRVRIWLHLPLPRSACKPSFLCGGSIPLPPSVRFRSSLWKDGAPSRVRAVAAEHATKKVSPTQMRAPSSSAWLILYEDFAKRLNSDAVGGIFPKLQNFGGAAGA